MTTYRPPRQNSARELAAFDRVCDTLTRFDPGIDFEAIDGFLASLAALPPTLRPGPDDWLPALFGDTFERAFADPLSHAEALLALTARLDVLFDELDPQALLDDPDLLRFQPFIADADADADAAAGAGTGADVAITAATATATAATTASVATPDVANVAPDRAPGAAATRNAGDDAVPPIPLGAVWADGFMTGVDAFSALWTPPSDEAGVLFQQSFDQISALMLQPSDSDWAVHMAAHYPDGEPSRERLLGEACMAVQDLRLLWVDFAPKPPTRRVEQTPGRNDPCPCGSGRKFKKCHGAG